MCVEGGAGGDEPPGLNGPTRRREPWTRASQPRCPPAAQARWRCAAMHWLARAWHGGHEPGADSPPPFLTSQRYIPHAVLLQFLCICPPDTLACSRPCAPCSRARTTAATRRRTAATTATPSRRRPSRSWHCPCCQSLTRSARQTRRTPSRRARRWVGGWRCTLAGCRLSCTCMHQGGEGGSRGRHRAEQERRLQLEGFGLKTHGGGGEQRAVQAGWHTASCHLDPPGHGCERPMCA